MLLLLYCEVKTLKLHWGIQNKRCNLLSLVIVLLHGNACHLLISQKDWSNILARNKLSIHCIAQIYQSNFYLCLNKKLSLPGQWFDMKMLCHCLQLQLSFLGEESPNWFLDIKSALTIAANILKNMCYLSYVNNNWLKCPAWLVYLKVAQ